MKHFFPLAIFTLCSFALGFGQITITSDDVMGMIGKSFTQEEALSDSISIMPGMAGADQNWDFSAVALDSSLQITLSFISPDNTPFADSFPEANFVQLLAIDSIGSFNTYVFSKVTETDFISIGGVAQISFPGLGDTTLFTTSADTNALFPLTYEKTWVDTETDTTDLGGFIDISIDTTVYTVDAYGTASVPAGSFETLRIRQDTRSISKSSVQGVELPGTDERDISYVWVAKEAYLVASMSGLTDDTTPNFSTASSFGRLFSIGDVPVDTTGTDTTMNPVDTTMTDTTGMDTTATPLRPLVELVEDIDLSPNPAVGSLTLSYTLGEQRDMHISIYDFRGRRIHTLVNGMQVPDTYRLRWDGRTTQGVSIRPGWYIAIMRSGTHGHAMKFMWQNR